MDQLFLVTDDLSSLTDELILSRTIVPLTDELILSRTNCSA
ncbi:hypothetical protein [Peribacillus butanolivorans]